MSMRPECIVLQVCCKTFSVVHANLKEGLRVVALIWHNETFVSRLQIYSYSKICEVSV